MKDYLLNCWTQFQLKWEIRKIIKANVSPSKWKQSIVIEKNDLKLKIVSERVPGLQRVVVYLDNKENKTFLSSSYGRRSTKRMSIRLSKKIQHEYSSVLSALKSKNAYLSFFQKELFSR